MNRPDQNDEDLELREAARNVVVEFSNSPYQGRWDESTPSQISETRSNEHVVQVQAVVDSDQPQMPTRIANRYDILSELGKGGQASVYLAEDTTLGRKVAIKMPRAGYSLSRQQQEQFQQEARSIAALKHPGIVTVHDFGIHDDGRCYIVLEYLPGQSLKDCLKKPDAKQSFTIERSIQLISRIAEALHYAHQRGIYHRDLKPGNILLDEHGNPRISDFGLAVTQESQRVLKGQVAGTLPYMAPEQVRGESHWLNGQADIWALGVILYEMLAGRRPFQGTTEEELKEEILLRTPTPLRQMNDRIPREVDEVVMRCLAKDATYRFRDAEDVVFQTTKSTPLSVTKKSWTRPAKWIGTIACTILLAALLGIVARTIPVTEPKELIPGAWNEVLSNRTPESLVWRQDNENSKWTYHPKEQRVSLETTRLGLLKLADIPFSDFDVECQLRQARWRANGSIGIFFGYRPASKGGEDARQIQAFVVGSRETQQGTSFSLNRRRIVWPTGQDEKTTSDTFATAKIRPQDLKWLQVLVRVRKSQVVEILVDNQRAPALTSANAEDAANFMEKQEGASFDCRGPFGLYVDGGGRGVSGEFRLVRIMPNP
jgi:serine/threonine protein kinase